MESTNQESHLENLLDLVFVPSSILRLAHEKSRRGEFKPREEYKDSKLAKIITKVFPYILASAWEGARLYAYYKIAEQIIS